MNTKRPRQNQQYEDYWKLTLEYSDFYGAQFNGVLKTIVNFIDMQSINAAITTAQYKNLQSIIENQYFVADSASTRKSINQFLKLGFINNGVTSYHPLTKQFLEETDIESKRLIYSQIMYDNASFKRSVTNPTTVNEIKFLVKTLESCSTLDKNDLLALIYTDVTTIPKGYYTRNELDDKKRKVLYNGADSRKYNQCNYLFNLCKSLTDLYVNNGIVSLNVEIEQEKFNKPKTRDPYLQHLYKIELIKEYKQLYNTTIGKCVLEKLAYPTLIASHIKPYKDCDTAEQFDSNNGLLLSKNMDSLFDNGYITFDDQGIIITSPRLDSQVASYVKQFKLDQNIYNLQRKEYMKYHRVHVFMS